MSADSGETPSSPPVSKHEIAVILDGRAPERKGRPSGSFPTGHPPAAAHCAASHGDRGRSEALKPCTCAAFAGDEAYVVTDGLGQRLAYLYFEDESIRKGIMKRLSKDDAWRIARAISRIPALMRRD
jgi:hypothetical protein